MCELVATGIAEAQKGEPMSDLIDRKAILKKIENIRNGVQMMRI